ncbi:MAG: hypothetical protein SynsKO_09680 [Synoicihabitans sp.]
MIALSRMRPNLSIFLRLLLVGGVGLIFGPSSFALEDDISPEATEEVRQVSAREKLQAESSTIVLYAEGLCCPSCAIGVRKKVSRLDYVDRKRFNKGVALDARTQLVSVAIDASVWPDVDLATLSQAVWDAGYTPVRAYQLEGDSVLATPLPQPTE